MAGGVGYGRFIVPMGLARCMSGVGLGVVELLLEKDCLEPGPMGGITLPADGLALVKGADRDSCLVGGFKMSSAIANGLIGETGEIGANGDSGDIGVSGVCGAGDSSR